MSDTKIKNNHQRCRSLMEKLSPAAILLLAFLLIAPAPFTWAADGTAIDIRNKTISNFTFDESSGMLKWDALEGAESYSVNVECDGSAGHKLNGDETANTYLNIYDSSFADDLKKWGTAKYTFSVRGRGDQSIEYNHTEYTSIGPFEMTPHAYYTISLSVKTTEYEYNTRTKRFEQDSRRRSISQGGYVMLNGTSINTVHDQHGKTVYFAEGSKEFPAGTPIEVKAKATEYFRIDSMEIDGKAVDSKTPGTATIKADAAHHISVTFSRPLADLDSDDLKLTSSNLDDVAQSVLREDSSLLDILTEGYFRVDISNVKSSNVSAADRKVLSADDAVHGKDLKGGAFYEVDMFKKLDYSGRSVLPKTAVKKLSEPLKLKITIPSDMRSDSGRTYYLIRTNGGDPDLIAEGTGSVLDAEISRDGVYLLAYADRSSGPGTVVSNATAATYYAAAVSEQEEEEETEDEDKAEDPQKGQDQDEEPGLSEFDVREAEASLSKGQMFAIGAAVLLALAAAYLIIRKRLSSAEVTFPSEQNDDE